MRLFHISSIRARTKAKVHWRRTAGGNSIRLSARRQQSQLQTGQTGRQTDGWTGGRGRGPPPPPSLCIWFRCGSVCSYRASSSRSSFWFFFWFYFLVLFRLSSFLFGPHLLFLFLTPFFRPAAASAAPPPLLMSASPPPLCPPPVFLTIGPLI